MDFISREYDARRGTPCHPMGIVPELFLDQHRYSHLILVHRKVVLACCLKLLKLKLENLGLMCVNDLIKVDKHGDQLLGDK